MRYDKNRYNRRLASGNPAYESLWEEDWIIDDAGDLVLREDA